MDQILHAMFQPRDAIIEDVYNHNHLFSIHNYHFSNHSVFYPNDNYTNADGVSRETFALITARNSTWNTGDVVR